MTFIGALAGLPGGALMMLPGEVLLPQNRAAGMGIFFTWYYAGLAFSATQAESLCPCPTNTLINARPSRRFAQAALEPCSSLEQHRDLATCPTFIPLNAELVVCHTSRQRTSR